MIELGGPWGPKILADERLSAPLRARLDDADVRVLLIRRHGRTGSPAAGGGPPDDARIRVMASWSSAGSCWLESTTVAHPDELLALDLDALGRGERPGWEPVEHPITLVCTHGRRDACCAELGRPVAAALAAQEPDRVWECSHVGGHRYAPNVVILPGGLTYGRVDPAAAADVVARAYAGRVQTELLRGRVWQSGAEQAVEIVVRQRLGLDGDDQVATVAVDGGEVVVEVTVGPHAGRHRVTAVRRPLTGPDGTEVQVLASCGDEAATTASGWDVGPLLAAGSA